MKFYLSLVDVFSKKDDFSILYVTCVPKICDLFVARNFE